VKRAIPWSHLAIEFVVIVVGVLLALAVDQWAERRENQGLADEVLQALGAELGANLEQIERRIAYHEEILPRLDSLRRASVRGERLRVLESDVLPRGFGFWLLRDTAWQTALVTEAVRYFDLSMTTVLSTTYSLQNRVGEMQRTISDGILTPDVFGASDQGGAVIFLAAMLEDLVGSERELKSFFEASLEQIRERLGDVSLESPMQVSLGAPRFPASDAPGAPAYRTGSDPAPVAGFRARGPGA